jgi:hypothetical protein
VEEVSAMKHHVYIVFFGETHHFVEGTPTVVFTVRIALVVADMAIGGHEDADRIGCVYIELSASGTYSRQGEHAKYLTHDLA